MRVTNCTAPSGYVVVAPSGAHMPRGSRGTTATTANRAIEFLRPGLRNGRRIDCEPAAGLKLELGTTTRGRNEVVMTYKWTAAWVAFAVPSFEVFR
jgi:hypothetical protein